MIVLRNKYNVRLFLGGSIFVFVIIAILLHAQNEELAGANLAEQTRASAMKWRVFSADDIGHPGISAHPLPPSFDALSQVSIDIEKQLTGPTLSLREAAFHRVPAQAGGVVGQMQINVSATGSSGALHQALGSLLSRHGELALRSLVVSRDGAGNATLRMEASLIFFYRN